MRNIDVSKLINVNDILDAKYGKIGTFTREEFEKEAILYYYGTTLCNRRKKLKMTQQLLAESVGVERGYISRIERGEVDFTLSCLVRIAKALGMELELV